jgi:hemerythrin-like domain-containing protein
MAKNRGVVSSLRSLLSFGEEQAEGKTATALLHEDHERVDGLFRSFESAKGNAEKRDIAAKTVAELRVHAAIEEELFYRALARELEDDEPVKYAVEEHAVVKRLLDDLEGMKPSEDTFHAKYKVLSELVRHHVREEEGQIFPAAESSDLDLDALGRELAERKHALIEGRRGAGRARGDTRGSGRARSSRSPARGGAARRSRARGAAAGRAESTAKSRGGGRKKAASAKGKSSRSRRSSGGSRRG